MKLLDLFSGIGGFSLAAHCLRWKTIGFVEIDKYCQSILRKNFPGVAIIDDIRNVSTESFQRPDIISGGFPCQPFSSAGKRKGKDDNRFLWPQMLRVIALYKPRWIVGENVAGIINMALDDCLASLEGEGYETQTLVIPACATNAPHRRDRVWIIGHAKHSGQPSTEKRESIEEGSRDHQARAHQTKQSERSDCLWGIPANTDDQRQQQPQGHIEESRGWTSNSGQGSFTDTNGQRLQKRKPITGSGSEAVESSKGEYIASRFTAGNASNTDAARLQGRSIEGSTSQNRQESDDEHARRCEIASSSNSTSKRLQRRTGQSIQGAGKSFACPNGPDGEQRQAISGFCNLDDGLSERLAGLMPSWSGGGWLMPAPLTNREADRAAKLKALGNSIVPQVAYEIFRAIDEIENKR